MRPKRYGDDARALLEHVWALMGFPCGKYLIVMLPMWLLLLEAGGDLDKPFATKQAVAELQQMSAATIDRYLAPARSSMRLKGISTTTASPLLRNSIGLSKVGDEPASIPGVAEADTVAHCGPTFVGLRLPALRRESHDRGKGRGSLRMFPPRANGSTWSAAKLIGRSCLRRFLRRVHRSSKEVVAHGLSSEGWGCGTDGYHERLG